MNADFMPSILPYHGLKPFRFWCQKVLPLVYDDSLSYYELLCKVVDYLNKVIQDLKTTTYNVDQLAAAFLELQKYVNEYFDATFPEKVDEKLDELVENGTLEALLGDYIENVSSIYITDLENGLRVRYEKRGGFVWVYINGRTTAELQSSGAYIDLHDAPVQMYPDIAFLVYQQISHRYTAQLSMLKEGENAGKLRLGYTYDTVDGAYENIPANTLLAFMYCYKAVDEAVTEQATTKFTEVLDNGLTVSGVKRGGFAWVYVRGILNTTISTQDAYFTLYDMPVEFAPETAFLVYHLLNHRYTAQLAIPNTRKLNIGYTYDSVDGEYEDVPEGARLNFMFCYKVKG